MVIPDQPFFQIKIQRERKVYPFVSINLYHYLRLCIHRATRRILSRISNFHRIQINDHFHGSPFHPRLLISQESPCAFMVDP